jgi:hypothetical protein
VVSERRNDIDEYEKLIIDPRAKLTPAEHVEQRLIKLLGSWARSLKGKTERGKFHKEERNPLS